MQTRTQNRVFFPQAALDQWLEEGAVDLAGNALTILAEGRKYDIVEGVHVTREVTGSPDASDLVGRVKDKPALLALGAEVLESSMIVGENAYDVVPGWIGSPVGVFPEHRGSPPGTAPARAGEASSSAPVDGRVSPPQARVTSEEDLLGRLLLGTIK